MNTKGKIDFTKTDNIQFIEEVASEISKEDKNWQWEAREIKQHSLLLWWEYLEDTLDLKSTMRSVFWYASSRY